LFSSHTDTVHRKHGRQKVYFDSFLGHYFVMQQNDCLGADDAAGVYVMTKMIEAKIPGLYIFHTAEEIGGLGSSYIAKHDPTLLDGIDHAIAFDRKGTKSIITHQGERCCSNDFAEDLADRLGMDHILDSTGIFTDTANYTDLVPECTNISVGYEAEHTSNETLDRDYLLALTDAACSANWKDLVKVRKAGEEDPDYADWPMYGSQRWSDLPDADNWEHRDDQYWGDRNELDRLCQDHPYAASDLLYETYGPDAAMYLRQSIGR
jgi:hypothetical protein